MKLDYNKFKAFGQVIAPAIITCVVTIMTELGCECTETVTIILGALLTCYNSIIINWNKDYYQDQLTPTEVTSSEE